MGGGRLDVPGDFSSAAFPLVAAILIPGSEVRLAGVGVNPTRTGLYDLLAEMGGDLTTDDRRPATDSYPPSASTGEPIADLIVRGSALRGIAVGGAVVVRAIDEFPIFAVAATQAAGVTTIREAAELRVKESDRIVTVAGELRKMGAQIEERPDGMILHGPARLHGAAVECHRDHRLAMSLAVAGLVAEGPTEIRGAEAINDSFPGFAETMRELGADVAWVDSK
jgi:3-phosphoshikimate 1-carboxyvinyltransferase